MSNLKNKLVFFLIITPIFLIIITSNLYFAYITLFYPNYNAYCSFNGETHTINTKNITEYRNFIVFCNQEIEFYNELQQHPKPEYLKEIDLFFFNRTNNSPIIFNIK